MQTMDIYDLKPLQGDFLQDVLQGLAQPQPSLSPKYLYDDRGAELFTQICETPEYYVTRTEVTLLRDCAEEIGALAGPETAVIELGVGMSDKAQTLLAAMREPALYAATEINRMALEEALSQLRGPFAELPLAGIVADFTSRWSLPENLETLGQRRLCFLPGSTIGNFSPAERHGLLCSIRDLVGEGGSAVVGFDLVKDRQVLESAYDDSAGVTAAFNLNLLHRMRRELDADLDPDGFVHRAFYNPDERRVEMHLQATSEQRIRIGERQFAFAPGDSIHTENSHKFVLDELPATAREAGFGNCKYWTDSNNWFALLWLAA